MSETTIPLLPCQSLTETLDFYQALGFTVTHQQASPYLYASVQRGGVELHCSSLKVYGAGKSFGASLVFVTGVADYHRAFADGLRLRYGTIPTAGVPRLTRLRPGQTRFFVFDPSGNIVVYIDRDEQWAGYDTPGEERSPLALALENANFLRDTYANDVAAAKVLGAALARHDGAAPLELARALAARGIGGSPGRCGSGAGHAAATWANCVIYCGDCGVSSRVASGGLPRTVAGAGLAGASREATRGASDRQPGPDH